MLMKGPRQRQPSELVVIHHQLQKRYCGRLTLNLTKVCPWSLPSTTHLTVLRWLLVSASLCATFCTYSYQKYLARVEVGGEQNRGSDGASKKSSTGIKKCNISKQSGSGCFPYGVCIPFTPIGIRINIWCLCEKVFGGHHFLG